MGTSLLLITNSKLTGSETKKDWARILNELKHLNMNTTSYLNNKEEWIKETGDWSYRIHYDKSDPFNVDYEGPFHIQPQLFSDIGILSTIYKYRLLYEIYEFDWFDSFRLDIFNIIKIIGGTEVIYLADNSCDKLGFYFECMALENVPYEEIKKQMIQELGQPVTDYSKLNFDSLNYRNITEFFLDDFADLKLKSLNKI